MQLEPGKLSLRRLSVLVVRPHRPRTRLPGARPGRATARSAGFSVRCPPLSGCHPHRADASPAQAPHTRPVLARNQPQPKLLNSGLAARREPAGKLGGGG